MHAHDHPTGNATIRHQKENLEIAISNTETSELAPQEDRDPRQPAEENKGCFSNFQNNLRNLSHYSHEQLMHIASIVESTDDAILTLNLQGKILTWNKGAEKMFGYRADEIIGQSILLLAPPERQKEITDYILPQIARGGKIYNYETIRKTKSGKSIHVSTTVSPLIDKNGKVTGVSSIIRDITLTRKLEQELMRLERLYLIGEMAAGISHEIRNPLSTVRGFLQMLSEKPELESYREHFALMIQEMDRANNIISEFLAIGRQKNSEKALQNLNDIIQVILPLIESDALRQDKYIATDLNPVPEQLLDADQIRQLIFNLVRNGLDAMESGKVLTLRTYTTENRVILEVEDQGSGIHPDILQKLGTPFLTTKANGTGLGLSVCFNIASRHNATIDVTTSDQGTTFRVIFNL